MLEYLEPKEKHQTKYIKIVPRRSFQSINASTLKKKRKLNFVHFSELTLNNLKQFEFLLSLVEMKLIIQPSNSQKVNIILLCYKKWDFFYILLSEDLNIICWHYVSCRAALLLTVKFNVLYFTIIINLILIELVLNNF